MIFSNFEFSYFFVPLCEILIMATLIYGLVSFFWNTRAMDLIFGLFALAGMYLLIIWLDFPVLEKLMLFFVNYSVIGLMILFQPELRLALSKLSLKGRKYRELTEFDKFIEAVTSSVFRMAEKRIGALIIIENHDSLDEFANKAVLLNARFSPELLESIFSTTTPLHDGGVIIRGTYIISAATIVPLADDSMQLSKSMGTRHRAGLGISQLTDALVIVVSEETGKVSIAREGLMTRGVKPDRCLGVLRSVLRAPRENATQGILDKFTPFKFLFNK
jgi:diadenylate cyclase